MKFCQINKERLQAEMTTKESDRFMKFDCRIEFFTLREKKPGKRVLFRALELEFGYLILYGKTTTNSISILIFSNQKESQPVWPNSSSCVYKT